MSAPTVPKPKRHFRFASPGDSLTGTLLGFCEGSYKGGDAVFSTDEGEVVGFNVTTTLDRLHNFEPGTRLVVTFREWITSKSGYEYKQFDINRKDDV